MELITAISLIGGALGIVFGVSGFLKGQKKESKEEAKELTLLRADLDRLDDDLKETRKELISFKRESKEMHTEQRQQASKELGEKFSLVLTEISELRSLIIQEIKK
tara:strand:- start:65 stop:382 length:318 start_codon:yes stop_codon:yes gene_type:complete